MSKQRKSYAKELVRERTGREPDELLRELYLVRRHTQQEIAEALGIGRIMVSQWLAEYGIRRDDRPRLEIPA